MSTLAGEVFYKMPMGGWAAPSEPPIKCHIRLVDEDEHLVFRWWNRSRQRWEYESMAGGLMQAMLGRGYRTTSAPLLAWLETKRWRCPTDAGGEE